MRARRSHISLLLLYSSAAFTLVGGRIDGGNWSRWRPLQTRVWIMRTHENVRANNVHASKDPVWCAGYLCVRGGAYDQNNNGTDESAKGKKPKRTKSSTKVLVEETSANRLHKKVRQKVRRGRHKLKATVKATLAKTTLPSREALREWSMWTNHTSNKAKASFYDKIELVSQALLRSEMDASISSETDHDDAIPSHDLEITHQSDLTRPGRKIFVVTTASLPWFTGTAVNPLLRAAYLCRKLREINSHNLTTGEPSEGQWVTLVIPWLELEEDRLELYGSDNQFANQTAQEQYIRAWLRDEAGMPDEADEASGLRILWYPSRYHPGLKSIFAMGD